MPRLDRDHLVEHAGEVAAREAAQRAVEREIEQLVEDEGAAETGSDRLRGIVVETSSGVAWIPRC